MSWSCPDTPLVLLRPVARAGELPPARCGRCGRGRLFAEEVAGEEWAGRRSLMARSSSQAGRTQCPRLAEPRLAIRAPLVAAHRRCDVSYSTEVDGQSQLSTSSLVESLDLDERPLHARSVRRRHGPHQEAAKAANGVAVQGREMTQRRRPLRGWRRSTTRSTRAQERNPTSQHSATRTGRL